MEILLTEGFFCICIVKYKKTAIWFRIMCNENYKLVKFRIHYNNRNFTTRNLLLLSQNS